MDMQELNLLREVNTAMQLQVQDLSQKLMHAKRDRARLSSADVSVPLRSLRHNILSSTIVEPQSQRPHRLTVLVPQL